MARDKIKSEPIDGFVYEVHQLPATKGEELGAELIAMIVPMLGALAGEGKGEAKVGSVGDLDLGSLGLRAAAEAFATAVTSPKLRNIRKLMAEHTEIYGPGFGNAGLDAGPGDGDGGPLSKNYDDHFAGRYDAMIEWFLVALEVNFKDFFGGLWGRLGSKYPLLRALPAALSNLPATSTGESGESSSLG